ncbi:fumarylacetoacetate hydrolase family protein [Siphonobacter aquaeclarae]|uniref:2-keto-4-pentenoate hydratase/2-oxohepta-3-ene-1,7-dioic acid hydratase (Catechol pathway) n=1 Tax=Siphonobacter aquaeclarae TaxID=563176 RepID=A0A1G9KE65_9BACT|nr:fumarylacetoacetate hydrolase family protein [Siphonobacter aquaeclarae]SDL47882.1 2-keto-4-pentenoate hydratase/2-oxohepta-3-ene-1,7-dioic acid hydratase (catechol pathway) [Siphonobacter aquaeclarae]
MRIFCIGRNYAEHIAELQNERPAEPVIFSKPDSAILRKNSPFYLPDFTQDVHHELEIVLKINKLGKNIPVKFADNYYEEIGLGIDFTARDVQSKLKAKGLPWDIAKGFDGSAPISDFLPKSQFPGFPQLTFDLKINGETRQEGDTSLMLWSFGEIIAYLSKFFTLKIGDLIFTGTPAGVGPVKIGDRLTASLEGQTLLDFDVK